MAQIVPSHLKGLPQAIAQHGMQLIVQAVVAAYRPCVGQRLCLWVAICACIVSWVLNSPENRSRLVYLPERRQPLSGKKAGPADAGRTAAQRRHERPGQPEQKARADRRRQRDGRKQIQLFLEADQTIAVDTASNGSDALKALDERPYSVVVTDLKMPRVGRFAACSKKCRRDDCRPT